MALCSDGGPLQVWDLRERRRLPTPWLKSVDACQGDGFHFTPDSRALAIGTTTGIRTWEVRSGSERPRIDMAAQPQMAFSADGTHLATLTENEVLLWRTALPTVPVLRFPTQGRKLFALRLDMAKGVIRYAAGEQHAFTVRTIHFGATQPRDWERTPLTHAEFSPDGKSLATLRAGRYELRSSNGKLRRRALSQPGV